MNATPNAARDASDAKQLRISEIFRSLQGEGPNAGAPCLFIRLALCNLHCHWCDTKYTWDWQHFRYEDEVTLESTERIAELIRGAPSKHVVITGGEPLLQQRALLELLAEIPSDVFVEIETNGTQLPEPGLIERINQWNVSPKLASAGDPEELRHKPAVLAALLGSGRAHLKLVVESEADFADADALVAELDWPPNRVWFMPQARSKAELERSSATIAGASLARGFSFSTRLQLLLFDGRRGA